MSSMKGISKTAYHQIWLDHVKAWHKSCLSQKAYGELHSLQPWQLGYWVRRFKRASPDVVDTALHSFVPVQITSASSSHAIAVTPSVVCQLTLTNGVVFSCDQLPDPAWLATVLRAL
jgi:hypothetical protein